MNRSNPIENLRALVAVSENGVIGNGNQLPWHLPEELKLFKKLTLGHTVILGRKTFDAIGKPLPHREMWILTRSEKNMKPTEGIRWFSEMEILLGEISKGASDRQFWIIGGAEIYNQLIPFCSEIICSRIHRTCPGDVFWSIPANFHRESVFYEGDGFTTYRYSRNAIGDIPMCKLG